MACITEGSLCASRIRIFLISWERLYSDYYYSEFACTAKASRRCRNPICRITTRVFSVHMWRANARDSECSSLVAWLQESLNSYAACFDAVAGASTGEYVTVGDVMACSERTTDGIVETTEDRK